MKARANPRKRSLVRWLVVGTVLIALSAVITITILQLIYLKMGSDLALKKPLFILTFLVTAGVVGAAAGAVNYRLNQNLSRLTRGLEAIADGDFSVRLDPSKAGPMSSTYEDFNKMGKELQSIQTLREDFINNFSHEFKTPITAVQGFAELLQEPDLTEEDRRQYTQIILNESTRLASMADSALLLTHLEAQQVIPDQAPYALDEQIKQCAILLSGQWERKHIAFSAELEEASFVGNQEVMRHVWLNLLNNAIKYTPEGGEITVTLTVSAGEIAVRVSDTGIGMDEETQRHVFDKYYQGPAGKKARVWAWGSPLSIALWNCAAAASKSTAWRTRAARSPCVFPRGLGKVPPAPDLPAQKRAKKPGSDTLPIVETQGDRASGLIKKLTDRGSVPHPGK